MEKWKKRRVRQLTARMAAILFLTAVFGLAILNRLTPDREFSSQENRILEQRPDLRLSSLADGTYMEKYETYQSDQFAGRDTWIEVSTGMEYLLGRRDSGGVYKGEDHYLLEKIESDEGDNVQDNIEAVRSFAEKNQERKIYFLIAPNAAEILQDKLPAFAAIEDQKGQLERLRASLPEQIRWIDACGALEAHRDEEIYYRTDHHWTTLGAWYAFQEAKKVMDLNEAYTEKLTPRAVSDSFNGTLSARSGYERGFREPIYIYFPDGTEGTQAVVYDVEKGEKTASLYAPEKLKEKDQYAVFLGGNRPLLDIRTTSESPERLLIFKDSYANCLIPFLVPYFRQILVVDPRYYYGDVEALIRENQIGSILFLYNGNTFFTDNSLSGVLAEEAG